MQVLLLHEEEMKSAITKRSTKITVVGLGKMGLPIAMVFTNSGYQVSGLDISQDLVQQLNTGKTDMLEEPLVAERLSDAVKNGVFSAHISVEEAVSDSAFVIIIIPVITTDDGQAEIDVLLKTYKKLIDFAPKGCIFIQESTLPPGTTSGIINQTLEISGKKSGIDFGLVFAPERTFSGRVIADIEDNYPKLIGGHTTNAAQAASLLYNSVCKKGIIQLSNATTAEAVKTFKGAYRDANIAIANQFAILSDLYQIDVLEVINAANTEPFSHIHQPGIGVGGHCIPVYPQFLISEGKEKGIHVDIFSASRSTNDGMVSYSINSIEKYLDHWKISILILGLAYRGGVKEHRYSPTLRLVPQLRLKGAIVKITDPLYSVSEINRIFGENLGVKWDYNELIKYDIIYIVTDHPEFYNIEDKLKVNFVYDGRYVLEPSKSENFMLLQPGRFYLNTK